VLERAVASDLDHLAGSCANILQHRVALWTFVDGDGIEPTNNHAESAVVRRWLVLRVEHGGGTSVGA
jgi:hypothetical protein